MLKQYNGDYHVKIHKWCLITIELDGPNISWDPNQRLLARHPCGPLPAWVSLVGTSQNRRRFFHGKKQGEISHYFLGCPKNEEGIPRNFHSPSLGMEGPSLLLKILVVVPINEIPQHVTSVITIVSSWLVVLCMYMYMCIYIYMYVYIYRDI